MIEHVFAAGKPRLYYLRDKNLFPVACIASQIDGMFLKFAFSTHNPDDLYNRRHARNKALGRLAQKLGDIKMNDGIDVETRNLVEADVPPSDDVIHVCLNTGTLKVLDQKGQSLYQDFRPAMLKMLVKCLQVPQRVRDAAKYNLKHYDEIRAARRAKSEAKAARHQQRVAQRTTSIATPGTVEAIAQGLAAAAAV